MGKHEIFLPLPRLLLFLGSLVWDDCANMSFLMNAFDPQVYKVSVPSLQTGVQQELSDPSSSNSAGRQAPVQASTLPFSKPVSTMHSVPHLTKTLTSHDKLLYRCLNAHTTITYLLLLFSCGSIYTLSRDG